MKVQVDRFQEAIEEDKERQDYTTNYGKISWQTDTLQEYKDAIKAL